MTRILSALVLLPIVVAILFLLPPWGTLALALVVLIPAVSEMTRLAEHQAGPLPRVLVFIGAAAVVLSLGASWFPLESALLAMIIAVACALVADARPDVDVLRRAGVMILPMIYLGVPFGALVAIRRDRGAMVVLLLIATTVVSDTAQYYGGRAFGRRPLAPRISPKKTVEGAVSGVIAGSLVLPLAGASILPAVPVWLLWIAGAVLVGLGIVGDLFESLLKRSVGVKDSSGLIPGHGGVLDRVDSLLLAAPFYYSLLKAVG